MTKLVVVISFIIGTYSTSLYSQGSIFVGENANVELNGNIFFGKELQVEGTIIQNNSETIFDSGQKILGNGSFKTFDSKVTHKVTDTVATYIFNVGRESKSTSVTISFTEAPNGSGYISVQTLQLYDEIKKDIEKYPDPVSGVNPNMYFFQPTFYDSDGYILDRHSTIFWEIEGSSINSGKYDISIEFEENDFLKGIDNQNDLHLVMGDSLPVQEEGLIHFITTGTHIPDSIADETIHLRRNNMPGDSYGLYFIGTNWQDNILTTPPADDLIFYEPFSDMTLQANTHKFGWKKKADTTFLDLDPSAFSEATEAGITQINGDSVYQFSVYPDSIYDKQNDDGHWIQKFRSELTFTDNPFFSKKNPAELWYYWEFYIDSTTNILDDFKSVTIGQWHSSGYFEVTGLDSGEIAGVSPVVEINYRHNDETNSDAIRLNIRSKVRDIYRASETLDINLNYWHKVKLHIIWGHSSNDGLVEFWFDTAKVDTFQFPNLQNSAPNFPKLGIYANNRKDKTTPLAGSAMKINYNNFIIAKTEEALDSVLSGSSQKALPNLYISEEKDYKFSLYQNYPNPFNPTTTISYKLDQQGLISIKVYNVLGQLVSTLVNHIQDVGQHSVIFNANSFPSGVYFYSLETTSGIIHKKMLLLK